MNYEKIYTNLILKAKKREDVDPSWADGEYTERHHWYPKSLYPEYSKEDWNLVRLTAKEHYLSHYLLHKMLPSCDKMSTAFWRMSNTNTEGKRHIPNSRSFEVARKAHAVAMSELHTGKVVSEETKEKISKANTGKVLSEETKEKMSKTHTGKVVSAETKERISKARTGKVHSKETKEKMSKAMRGMVRSKPARARPVNIYCHHTDELLTSNVLVGVWVKGTKYTKGNLCQTARADRSKPSSVGNQHHHKGIYARYIDQGG
jgi:hypothetical protein